MKTALQPGRLRGIKATSTSGHTFAILAFDQRNNYRQLLPPTATFQDAAAIKRDAAVALSDIASAVLLDPTYGLEAALSMSGHCGLLMALEESGYSGDSTYRRTSFDPDWTVAKIRRMGASAVKLLIYYHPDSGPLADEMDALVATVRDQCRAEDIPFFLEPLTYSLDAAVPKSSAGFARQRPRLVRETAARLSRLGPDILKLEFPVDVTFDTDPRSWAEACAAVSEASSVPWALLSAGVDFEMFERQVRVACQNGASGFIGGRAIWKECVVMSLAERQQFLAGIAAGRMRRLVAIAEAEARPWTDFYEPMTFDEEWYRHYR